MEKTLKRWLAYRDDVAAACGVHPPVGRAGNE
jgi:hypothetical protein